MKVSKEFWVSNENLDKIDSGVEFSLMLRNKDESSFMDSVINKATNKITITYDIYRDITINESDLENAFNDINIAGHSLIDLGVLDRVKKRLFGGGENE